ncbi:hypothetical protein [Hyphomicrobium sp.]|uniref:hypothetical protein n=1 Tax=Hyphomicrobium sp. TaxID=82 RepID=UPI002D787ABE|nr:hypothetical protein [Hyphomicrobium sp.]HET6388933.1 hypothetical protein [Hyphomicrobium sp.]
MTGKFSLMLAVIAAGVLGAAAQGMATTAAPLGALKSAGEMKSSIEQAHFWHRTCRKGLHGYHKHIKGIGRVQCTNHVCKHGKCWWY